MNNMENKYKKYIVDIHGKSYMTVAGRVAMFWDDAKDLEAGITTEAFFEGNEIRVKATAKQGNKLTTGWASEIVGSSMINKDSALENCESSAVGRALGNMGYGLLDAGGVASADEVQGAIQKQEDRVGSGKPASDKQKHFIQKLLIQKGQPDQPEDWYETLDGMTAKKAINKLMAMEDVQETEVHDPNELYEPTKTND